MITVKVKKFRKHFTSYKISGHAEYAENGKDIVCAAVSALGQTILLGLDEYCNVLFNMDMTGMMEVNIVNPDEVSDIIVKTMILGLQMIQKQYPEYITLTEEVIYE